MFSDIDMKKFCLLMTGVIANLLFMACSRNDNKTNDICTNKANESLHLDTVRNIPLKREILLNGKVDFAMENMTPVFPMISGIVKEVYGETGDHVGKGERLALIESEDIASIVKELKTAEHKLKLAERNYKAAEDMLRGGLSSEREVLNYRQELTEAEEELNRLNKLKAIYPIDENGLYILCSPVSGFITERNINRNYLIRPDSDKELSIPILMVTALGTTDDIVSGLDAGADDYISKPFSFAELQARIRALLRRREGAKVNQVLQCGDLTLDQVSRRATRNGETIDLTVKEYRLLEYFMNNQGIALSRLQLLREVWDKNFDTNTNIVDVYVNYLRAKIDKNHERKLIRTVVGLGYMMEG